MSFTPFLLIGFTLGMLGFGVTDKAVDLAKALFLAAFVLLLVTGMVNRRKPLT